MITELPPILFDASPIPFLGLLRASANPSPNAATFRSTTSTTQQVDSLTRRRSAGQCGGTAARPVASPTRPHSPPGRLPDVATFCPAMRRHGSTAGRLLDAATFSPSVPELRRHNRSRCLVVPLRHHKSLSAVDHVLPQRCRGVAAQKVWSGATAALVHGNG